MQTPRRVAMLYGNKADGRWGFLYAKLRAKLEDMARFTVDMPDLRRIFARKNTFAKLCDRLVFSYHGNSSMRVYMADLVFKLLFFNNGSDSAFSGARILYLQE